MTKTINNVNNNDNDNDNDSNQQQTTNNNCCYNNKKDNDTDHNSDSIDCLLHARLFWRVAPASKESQMPQIFGVASAAPTSAPPALPAGPSQQQQ